MVTYGHVCSNASALFIPFPPAIDEAINVHRLVDSGKTFANISSGFPKIDSKEERK